jgi:hypothetical protein
MVYQLLAQIVCVTPTPAAMVRWDQEIVETAFCIGNRRFVIKDREGRLLVLLCVCIAICFDLLFDDIQRVVGHQV